MELYDFICKLGIEKNHVLISINQPGSKFSRYFVDIRLPVKFFTEGILEVFFYLTSYRYGYAWYVHDPLCKNLQNIYRINLERVMHASAA